MPPECRLHPGHYVYRDHPCPLCAIPVIPPSEGIVSEQTQDAGTTMYSRSEPLTDADLCALADRELVTCDGVGKQRKAAIVAELTARLASRSSAAAVPVACTLTTHGPFCDPSCTTGHPAAAPVPGDGGEDDLLRRARWVLSMTVHPDSAAIMPAAMSHVKQSEWERQARSLIEALASRLSSVGATERDRLDAERWRSLEPSLKELVTQVLLNCTAEGTRPKLRDALIGQHSDPLFYSRWERVKAALRDFLDATNAALSRGGSNG